MFTQRRRVPLSIAALVGLLSACNESGLSATSLPPTAAPNQGLFPATYHEPATRPTLSRADLERFVPERGAFAFPEPWSSRGVRLTTAADCGGSDCVSPAGYSYWRNINNHANDDHFLVFVGLTNGTGPVLFSVDKATLTPQLLGPLFDEGSSFRNRTGEGFYFSARLPTALYVHEGARLYRYDVLAHSFTTVYDAAAIVGDAEIRQGSSSDDDTVHAAVMRKGGNPIGCYVHREATGEGTLFPAGHRFDECQIDRSGRWLLIKEDVDGKNAEDNRIIDLATGGERVILDENGALGHSDMGWGYAVGEDNWNGEPGAVMLWRFDQPDAPGELVFHSNQWGVDAGHVSHTNAFQAPPELQYACSGQAGSHTGPRANELLCFPLDGSLRVLPVAPVMTGTGASGGHSAYGRMPKANVDITGRYIFWTSNLMSNRLDAFVAEIPAD
jgi:hypothetical protein